MSALLQPFFERYRSRTCIIPSTRRSSLSYSISGGSYTQNMRVRNLLADISTIGKWGRKGIRRHTSLSHHLDFAPASRTSDENRVPLGQHRQLDSPTTARDCVALCGYPANANEPLQQDQESRGDDEALATLSPCSSVQSLTGPKRLMAGPGFLPDRAARLQAGKTFLVVAY